MMGGFRIEGYSYSRTPTAEQSPSTPSTNTPLTMNVLTFDSFVYVMKHFPDIIPDIPEESITDRAESSSLGKALLIVQVGWFCMNGASRLIQRLPISLLEVSTAAHGFCTLLVYLVWWTKPLNIAEGEIIKGEEAREVHALLTCIDYEYSEISSLAERVAAGDPSVPTNGNERVILAANALQRLPTTPTARPPRPFRIHTFSSGPGSTFINSTSHAYYEFTAMAMSPILYGLIHFLVWSDQFPTPLEHLFWRISSVVVLCSGLTAVTSMTMGGYLENLTRNNAAINVFVLAVEKLTFPIIPVAHVLASGFLVGESFRQLFFLGPAVYQLPSWSNYWPHLS
jgi:hypothetical protein